MMLSFEMLKAVSQGSKGSAGSHNDEGERQGPTERLPLGDLPPTRTERTYALLEDVVPISNIDLSLQSVC